MTKIKWVLATIVPIMEIAAGWLETLDENTTGKDDTAARALRVAVAAIKELSK